jgi:hypothetical protein
VSHDASTLTPDELERARSESSLDLSKRRLASLPPEIFELTDLYEMKLSGNRLTSLPPEIGQLRNLWALRLGGNRLSELPSEIGQLTELNDLWLSGNQLTTLPPEFSKLAKLRWLRLGSNQFAALPPQILQLGELMDLWLSGNRLTTLPSEIGRFKYLWGLRLGQNLLTNLPPEIGQLRMLHLLELDDNQLTSLPRELAGLLAGGLRLTLKGNPLQEPLSEIAMRGDKALVTYLRSLVDAIPQYEAKVLLVGEGNVGKTSLIAALRNEAFVEGRETTHGIEIHPISLPHPTQDLEMTVRTWDFGGQEVYRITHQFFFSRRCTSSSGTLAKARNKTRLKAGSAVSVYVSATTPPP